MSTAPQPHDPASPEANSPPKWPRDIIQADSEAEAAERRETYDDFYKAHPELKAKHVAAAKEQAKYRDREAGHRFFNAIPPRYRECSVPGFTVKHKGQQETLDRLNELIARMPELIKQGSSIVFFGTPGTGKDHLMVCLLRYMAKNQLASYAWTMGGTLYAEIRQRNKGEETDKWHGWKSTTVLCVSDLILPGADPKEWEINHLFDLIADRYDRKRPTWATINAASEEDLETRLTPPIFDRLKDNGILVPFFWPSYRSTEKANQ